MKSPLRWIGGKSRLARVIVSELCGHPITCYHEPMLGGGSVLLTMQPDRAIVGDVNVELVNFWRVLRDDVNGLIAEMTTQGCPYVNDEASFYAVRAWDRGGNMCTRRSPVERAARFLFINRVGFNGLWRVNSRGEANVPFGKMKKPMICNQSLLREVSQYLSSHVEVHCRGFNQADADISPGDAAYIDPPYIPTSATSSFVGYNAGGFSNSDHINVRDWAMSASSRGCRVVVSNSWTQITLNLYRGSATDVRDVASFHSIASHGSSRNKCKEMLAVFEPKNQIVCDL